MKQKGINKIGILTAFLSFITGTVFFLIYFLYGSDNIDFSAYCFIIIAGLLNLGILLTLIVKSITDKENKKSYFRTLGIVMLNLPVAVLYFYFIIVLLDTMRIEFINETEKPITEIKILGCEPKIIDKLGAKESETIWIRITGDCSIRIEYQLNGELKTEYVFGYITSFMGHKSTYRIGSQ